MNQRQGVPSNLKLITTTINEECKAGEGINNTLMQVCVCEMYALVEFTLLATSLCMLLGLVCVQLCMMPFSSGLSSA